MAKDIYHQAIKNALVKDGWIANSRMKCNT
ncbi:hypothetical protein HCU40_13015 [Pseudanabaena biceps]|nr:hypothetical protein [Pseudanabaena biceps]